MALVASPAGNGRPRCPRHARTRPRVAKYSIRIAWHHGASGFLAPERPGPVAHLAGREDPHLAVPLITPCNQPSCGSREISAVLHALAAREHRRWRRARRDVLYVSGGKDRPGSGWGVDGPWAAFWCSHWHCVRCRSGLARWQILRLQSRLNCRYSVACGVATLRPSAAGGER